MTTIGELLHGTIDPSRIAMSGHSLGGYATYALAGGDDEVCDALAPVTYGWESLPYPQSTCGPTTPDPRIRAIVSLDGFSLFMRYDELARISVPSLIMGETVEHIGVLQSVWTVKIQISVNGIARPHAAINRSDSYRVDVTIANHMSFYDLLRPLFGLGSSWCRKYERRIRFSNCVALRGPRTTFDPANDPATRQIVTTYMLGVPEHVLWARGRCLDADIQLRHAGPAPGGIL